MTTIDDAIRNNLPMLMHDEIGDPHTSLTDIYVVLYEDNEAYGFIESRVFFDYTKALEFMINIFRQKLKKKEGDENDKR